MQIHSEADHESKNRFSIKENNAYCRKEEDRFHIKEKAGSCRGSKEAWRRGNWKDGLSRKAEA